MYIDSFSLNTLYPRDDQNLSTFSERYNTVENIFMSILMDECVKSEQRSLSFY